MVVREPHYMRDYMRVYKGVEAHPCDWCDEVEVWGTRRRYCSADCRRRAAMRRSYVKTRSCAACGSEFCRVPWAKKVATYCSESCLRLASRCGPFEITPAELHAMLVRSGGLCAACGDPFGDKPVAHSEWVIDHDDAHTGKRVRGLVHHQCNTGLGLARHDPEELFAWATYLARHTFDLRDLCQR